MEATSLPGQSPGPPEILVPNSSLQVPEVEAGGGRPRDGRSERDSQDRL